MVHSLRKRLSPVLTLAVGLHIACTTDTTVVGSDTGSGGGSEITNGIVGIATNQSGIGVADLRVTIYDTAYRPFDTRVKALKVPLEEKSTPGTITPCTVSTDSTGRFLFDSLPDGIYNVFGFTSGNDSGFSKMRIEFHNPSVVELDTCLLQKNGGVQGRAYGRDRRSPLARAYVYVKGSDLLTTTTTAGEFLLTGVPPNDYRLLSYKQLYSSSNSPVVRIDTIRGTSQLEQIDSDTLENVSIVP